MNSSHLSANSLQDFQWDSCLDDGFMIVFFLSDNRYGRDCVEPAIKPGDATLV